MENKKTAVELLEAHLIEYGFDLSLHKFEINQAKEMEKEQIIDANIAGQMFIAACPGHYKNDAEDYYKGTFNKD